MDIRNFLHVLDFFFFSDQDKAKGKKQAKAFIFNLLTHSTQFGVLQPLYSSIFYCISSSLFSNYSHRISNDMIKEFIVVELTF
jgi:hypothetical protein